MFDCLFNFMRSALFVFLFINIRMRVFKASLA